MTVEHARARRLPFDPPTSVPVWLASRSPRRYALLAAEGVPVIVRPAGVDDGGLAHGRVTPQQWVQALAFYKARAVANELRDQGERVGTVLGADTLCLHRGRLLGQPADLRDARSMLERMHDDTHATITGVCLIALADDRRWFVVDETEVRFGCLETGALDRYLATGEWQGKAGAYNLEDRLDDGWDIRCSGDQATVMGLPMQRLEPWFRRVREDSA